jgi:CheY-like chemotaxis protein/two-component sensor histidine kinase
MIPTHDPPLVERRRPQIELEQFLGIVSHALRNPVQAISTNAWLIKSRSTDEKLARPAEAIERQVARLSKVLDDLLDMVRVTRKTALDLATENVQKIVTAAVVATQGSVDSHRRELTVEMAGDALPVRADAPRLEQAIRNLLHNAVKYSSQQGLILVTVKREGSSAVIGVKDEGAGIAPEDLPNVFQLFVGGRAAKKHIEGGLGIGLHIARELVQAHGGSIEAESAGLGKGSAFTIRLPLAEAQIGAESLADDAAEAEQLAILVVDDNQDAADSLAEVLLAQGHNARAAYGGREAIELATQKSFDVALVDIGMPTVDGLEVARQIAKSPAGKRTLLVAVTGWGANADRDRSKEAGFAYHLTKPVDYDTLGALLATAARRQRA